MANNWGKPRLPPRWNKALSDLWGNHVRSALVVASVTVGLFAVGMITTMHSILSHDMKAGYAAINPANIVIQARTFDDDMVETARHIEGVKDALGLRMFDLMIRSGPDEWSRLGVEAVADFDEMTVNRVQPQSGMWPPKNGEMVLEKNKMRQAMLLTTPEGSAVDVKLPSGKIRRVPVVGVVHDQSLGAGGPGGFFLAPIQGYIDAQMLARLEQPDGYSHLLITVTGDGEDEAHLRDVANRVSKVIEDNGGLVYNAQVRRTSEHPNGAYVDAISGVLFLLGALVVFLSGFLITNTLQSLLNQQSQQIAIMKTVGARSFQVIGIYMALIFIFGLIALAISLPLSQLAAFRLVDFLSGEINFTVLEHRTPAVAVILQVVIALVAPQVAGILPILRGARVKIHATLAGSLVEADPAKRGWLDRRLAQVNGLPRPQLISLRNTFRHKARLALTLITLTLGGAIFIGTFNVRASLDNYVQKVGRYFMADVNLTMDQSYRISEIETALRGVPGVDWAEGWAYGRSELLLDDERASDAVQLLAPPGNSQLIVPMLLKGRWVQEADRGAIVLSERFLGRYPNLGVGDTLRLRVNGKKTEWVVVGFFQLVGKSAGFVAYTNYEYLSQLIGEVNLAPTYRVIASQPNLTTAQQRDLGARIEALLQKQGFGVIEVSAGRSLVEDTSRPLDTLTMFLLIMALLIALVGSIGLMGTMGMNVIDRTREIGVMRAIGASNLAVMSLVIVEGVLIGFISWVLAVIFALPISKLLADTIHMAIFDARAEFTFTMFGPLAWLGIVILLSILASVIPAYSAARLTIREALAYE